MALAPGPVRVSAGTTPGMSTAASNSVRLPLCCVSKTIYWRARSVQGRGLGQAEGHGSVRCAPGEVSVRRAENGGEVVGVTNSEPFLLG